MRYTYIGHCAWFPLCSVLLVLGGGGGDLYHLPGMCSAGGAGSEGRVVVNGFLAAAPMTPKTAPPTSVPTPKATSSQPVGENVLNENGAAPTPPPATSKPAFGMYTCYV